MLPKKSAGKQNVCIVLIDVDKYLGNSQQALPAKNYPMLPKKSTGNYPPCCTAIFAIIGWKPWGTPHGFSAISGIITLWEHFED